MNKKLILISGNNPQYLARVIEIAESVRAAGDEPVILDVSILNFGLGDAYNSRFLKFLGLTSPTISFHKELHTIGIRIEYPAIKPTARILPDFVSDAIHDAAVSALISYARDADVNHESIKMRSLWRRLVTGGAATFEVLEKLLSTETYEEILIPNGRFPYQRAAIEAARVHSMPITYFEKGDFSDATFMHKYSALDRIASQEDVPQFLSQFDSSLIEKTGAKWFSLRRPVNGGTTTNIYTRNFSSNGPLEVEPEYNWVGIFSSSQDEFASLGNEWHIHSWDSQFAAIASVLRYLGQNKHVYLRIHPNLATKAHRAYKKELREIAALQKEFPNLKIYMHDEKVNSYELIQLSEKVIVWDSTIGLEALALGTPAFELAASYYDIHTEIPMIFSPSDLQKLNQNFTPSTQKAIEFAAYLQLREYPITEETRMNILLLDIPDGFRKSALKLVTSGGNPTFLFFIRQMIDTIRHRGLRTNIKFLRSFLSSRAA